MIVYKFGGTSVGTPERMKKVARLITRDQEPKIVVLSAVSGTTNSLVTIGNYLLSEKHKEAKSEITTLRGRYEEFIKELFTSKNGLQDGQRILQHFFHDLDSLSEIPDFNDGNNKTVLAQGELLSTHLFHAYLKESSIPGKLIQALDFMWLDKDGEPDLDKIALKLNALITKDQEAGLYITQGFICRSHSGQMDNLKRGGSDYTASLIGAAIKATEVQIWTDIDGMHNNDPRVVENTTPISELTFDEAAELAYFGAKILHPASIQPAQKYKIPVWLKSTMNEQAHGTLIGEFDYKGVIKAIAAKDDITAIKIKSTRMLLAYGFLRKIFEIFEKYTTSIDMVTTSEVAVSLTIDDRRYLDLIIRELEDFGSVQIDNNMTIICVVGSQISEKSGLVQNVFNSLENIPVRMVSFGGSRNNISILLETRNKNQALQQLSKGFF